MKKYFIKNFIKNLKINKLTNELTNIKSMLKKAPYQKKKKKLYQEAEKCKKPYQNLKRYLIKVP